MEHNVSIPEWYLLVIATRGDMGDDDLPGLMQSWAETECARLGLNKKLREERRESLKRLRDRMKKTLGSDLMVPEYYVEDIEEYINNVITEARGEK